MSIRIEGPREGTGKLEGMKVYTATPILTKGGAAELLADFDKYWELVNKKDQLVSDRSKALKRPWLWPQVARLGKEIEKAKEQIRQTRRRLPL